MATQIQLRGDTSTNWATTNPTLADREFGYETNTGAAKIGDGITDWNDLDYFQTGGSGGPVQSDDITDATIIGKGLLTAADAAAARTVINAGASLVNSVAGRTGTVVLTQDDVTDGSTNKAYTATEKTKLAAITALADPTGTTANAATGKTTPVDADTYPISDSAASGALKKVSWQNMKATAKVLWDATYAPLTRTLTAGTGLTGGGTLAADRTFAVAYGTSSTTAAVGNDSRITGAAQSASLAAIATSGSADDIIGGRVPLPYGWVGGIFVVTWNGTVWKDSAGTTITVRPTAGTGMVMLMISSDGTTLSGALASDLVAIGD